LKVLLTGATGFVGSHVLDRLRQQNLPTAVVVRKSSNTHFIRPNLGWAELYYAGMTDSASLSKAMSGVTHVIHCAGVTKAARIPGFYEVNQAGTRAVVEAANAAGTVKRFLLVSSLAATGPGTAENPAREESPPSPVSDYGKSKLAGEDEVKRHYRGEFTIVRPPAVYGPRDDGFLPLFKAVNSRLLPQPLAPQPLSLVFVRDLAGAIVHCLDHPKTARRTYFASSRETASARLMAQAICREMGRTCLPLPLPQSILWLSCMLNQLRTAITGRAHILSRQKFAEVKAPGWVCDPSRLEQETGYVCGTGLEPGIRETVTWYKEQGWL
jgi:nucleoside-diphosphate-sugar epimerase